MRLVRRGQIAEHLGVVKDSIYRWIEGKGLPAHKVGKLWKFKKGEVDEYLKQASPGQPTEAPAEDARPIEDRYADDGSVTAADHAKFSLRTGGTQMMSAAKPPSSGLVPGERMSEKELADEYAGKKGSGLKVALIVIGLVVALGLVVGLTMVLGHKEEPPKKPAPAAAEPAVPAP